MSETFSRLAQTYSNSVLISTLIGNLLRLYAPISAKVIKPIHHYKQGDIVSVTGILESKEHKLFYMIGEMTYPYHYFELLNERRPQ
jgi:hypothetical protein